MLTPYQDRKMKILWLRFTHQMIFDRKKRTVERRKLIFKTKCALVPKIAVVRKEEGATAAASHLPSFTAG